MHTTSETIKIENHTPEFCFIIEQNRFMEINKNPHLYAEFIDSLKMEIFKNILISTEDEMEFVSQIDYALNMIDCEFKLPEIFEKQIIVRKEEGNIYILSFKKTEVNVPCRKY